MADDASEFGFTIFSSWFTVIAVTCSVVAVLSFYIRFYKSYRSKKGEVIVFTRYPVPGKSKTRLIPAIGKYAAAKLQVCMDLSQDTQNEVSTDMVVPGNISETGDHSSHQLQCEETEHIIRMLQKVYTSLNQSISVTLQYNGGTTAEMEYWLEKKLWGLPCTYRVQAGATLGEKLKNAIKESFARGNKSVIVIGADIPGISEEVIKMSFESLTKKSDMVIGKAEDGGYYLIGFNINSLRYIDEIFDNIDWGTDRVFLQQIKNANNVGAMVHELPIVLQDVDTEEDIHVFEREVGVTVEELQDKTWSIIIPTLNEENNILNTLNNIQNCCSNTKHIKEVIISDGGSTDKTKYVVEQFSKKSKINVLVIDSKPGRGRQLLTGADRSTSNNYMFVHADTVLPESYDILALKCLSRQGVVAGAFKFQLDVLDNHQLLKTEPWWFILQMKALVWGTNARATKYEKPYGDQTLFMTKKTYKTVGGFPPYYLMEDYIMIEKLWTTGHIDIVDGPPVLTSYRRWRKYGYLKVTGLSQVIILAYKLGIHPNKLAQWYYGDKLKIE